MTPTTEAVKLPKVLPIHCATISVPDNLTRLSTFKEVVDLYKETATMLSYVYESNTCDIDYDDDLGWTFSTRDVNIIKYAVNHGFVDELSTVVETLCLQYGETLNEKELDDLIDTALDSDFSIQEMSDGKVYLIVEQ